VDSVIQISESNWHLFLQKISQEMNVYVPVKDHMHIDYKHFDPDGPEPEYNHPLPVTPLKLFFLPVKENVVIHEEIHNKNLIIGIPACDLKGLELLDEIYLDDKFPDPKYRENRNNTILIGSECHDILENCHCMTYGVNPCPDVNADATLVAMDGELIITAKTSKGKELINKCKTEFPVSGPASELLELAEARRSAVLERLVNQNRYLPDYTSSGELISRSDEAIWMKHARTCVSCGACAAICPTCTCFLLIDRPDFEKVRQLDACQYPGFERIAAGEDPLHGKPDRFRNRYMCKYVWKPEKFKALACTGCGRCIDCCIGNISKNKILAELSESS